MRTVLILTWGAVLVACGGPTTGGGTDAGTGPRIATIPGRVDFGLDGGTPVNITEVGTATLTLYNSGSGVLTMTAITLSGDPEFTATRPATMSLDAGERTDITITFSPVDVRAFTSKVQISSNAKNGATVAIPVWGVGKTP